MYRRWKKSDQPKEKQAPARETANEAALKRDEPVGKSLHKARWNNHRPHI
jgi:hypothetical protein